MMASNLFIKYSALGIVFSIAPLKRLLYKAPKGTITIEIKRELKKHKAEILFDLYQEQIRRLNYPEPWNIACLGTLTRPQPKEICDKQWNTVLTQLHRWIGQDSEQLREIIEKKWTLSHIFGCHKVSPQCRYDCMGLLLLIQGKTIEQIHDDRIVLKTSSGATQTFYKEPINLLEGSFLYTIQLAPGPPSAKPIQNVFSQLNEDERMEFEERAAIMEYDGNISRQQAEAQALKPYLS